MNKSIERKIFALENRLEKIAAYSFEEYKKQHPDTKKTKHEYEAAIHAIQAYHHVLPHGKMVSGHEFGKTIQKHHSHPRAHSVAHAAKHHIHAIQRQHDGKIHYQLKH